MNFELGQQKLAKIKCKREKRTINEKKRTSKNHGAVFRDGAYAQLEYEEKKSKKDRLFQVIELRAFQI